MLLHIAPLLRRVVMDKIVQLVHGDNAVFALTITGNVYRLIVEHNQTLGIDEPRWEFVIGSP
jgi:hypothetical protein